MFNRCAPSVLAECVDWDPRRVVEAWEYMRVGILPTGAALDELPAKFMRAVRVLNVAQADWAEDPQNPNSPKALEKARRKK